MNIIGSHSGHVHDTKQTSETHIAKEHSAGAGFLGVAKKIMHSAALHAEKSEKISDLHIKKNKEIKKPETPRTEQDAIADVEKLIRRIQRSRKTSA